MYALKPGGHIEVVEHSVAPVPDDATMKSELFFFTVWSETVHQVEHKSSAKASRYGKRVSVGYVILALKKSWSTGMNGR